MLFKATRLLLILSAFLSLPTLGFAELPRVLVISSYHIGFGGTDTMIDGIRTAFSKKGQEVDFYFEYLDSKRFSPETLFPATKRLYQQKYRQEQSKFDVIIVADNNALNFIRSMRESLFPDIPIVFCGINNYEDSIIDGMNPVTGVVEDISLAETVNLSLSLHPETTHIAVISDSTVSGDANFAKFKKIEPDLPEYLQVIDLSNLSATELAGKLEALPKNTILLQLSFYKDREGKNFTQKEQMDFILDHCDKPIYSAWDFFISHGVLGGVVTFFPLQGEMAGEMAIQLIKGKADNNIQVIKKSPNVPLFDYNMLEKFSIDLSDLPPESVIRNIPESVFQDNKILAWGVILFLLCQAAVIWILAIAIRRKKKSEALLSESEERFKKAMEASRDGLWDWKIDTGEAHYSPSYLTMLGYDLTELPHHLDTCLNLIHSEDREETVQKAQDCIENRVKNFLVEFRMQHKDGSWQWILCRGTALSRDREGKAIRLIGTHTDITRHKELESALKIGEDKMRSIFRAAPIGIGVVSNRVFTEVNTLFCEIVGYSKDELINHDSRMLYLSDADYAYVGREKYKQITERGSGTVETRMQRKNGAVLDILMSSSPLNPADWSEGVTFTALDITNAKKTENKLKESEEKYRTIMESMIDPLYICSSAKKISYMNPAMVKRIGRDATGEKCHNALHGLDKKCTWCHFFSYKSDDPYETDIVSPMDNRSYHVSSAPMTLSDGSVQKLTVFRDTTEMREIQSKLQRAQEMEAIGNLAGGIAHDFNNILTPIIGMAEILTEDLPPDSIEQENAYQILNAGNRGSELVRQILAFSRQKKYKKNPMRIQAVLKEVLKLCRASIPSSIEIEQDIPADIELIEGDSTQIHQVAMNLITNAYHAVEHTNGTIRVYLEETMVNEGEKLAKSLESGKYVLLSVSDTGCGISPEIVDKIFDPYFTTKEQGKGTGLGLATVSGIVKDHGGDIYVSSQPGEGTVFEVFLPLLNSFQSTTSTSSGKFEGQGGTESILVVDDEPPIAFLEKRMLERLGYRVTEQISSFEALKTFEANPERFDLVITDMTMPGMTGDKLTKKLLAIKPDLPIIICTGYSERINEINTTALGIKGLLMKPVLKNDLAKLVRESLDGA